MNNQGQWNMNPYFNNKRNRMQHRNKYQHHRYQNFPANFNRPWNSSVIDFDPNRYQPEFKPRRGLNRQHFRMINTNGNNNMRRRRSYGDAMGRRNSWALDDESVFEEPGPINFMPPVHQDRKPFHREPEPINYMMPEHQDRKPFHRESSLPPVVMKNRMHETRKPEFFDDRSVESDFSSSPFKRTIRTDHKSDKLHVAWSDSESDSKDVSWVESEVEHKSEEEKETVKLVDKDEQKLISMIWSDESDKEDSCLKKNEISSTQKGRCPFMYTTKSLPRYDGKTIIGDEGVFEIKVFQCTFCNIICLDKEKIKAHMLTKYHYKQYKKELEKNEEDTESENGNEEE